MMEHDCFAGWDIGGAYLKMVCVDRDGRVQRALQLAAPVWLGLENLRLALTDARRQLPDGSVGHGLTMTAELADCFPDRRSGVWQVLDVVEALLPLPIQVYGFAGFIDTASARRQSERVASANWHAGAVLVARLRPQAVFIDVGSTTSDIIPIRSGRPVARGYTDRARMQYDELVYTGVIRTPVMAVARRAPVAGEWQHLAAELFATMADVYRLTGDLPPETDTSPTVDGGSRDIVASARRLARMAGADLEDADSGVWRELAQYLKQQQLALLETAIKQTINIAGLSEEVPLIGAGCGRFLVRELAARVHRPYHDVATLLAAAAMSKAQAAAYWPAYAVAELLRLRIPA